jgi:hypothetical protein
MTTEGMVGLRTGSVPDAPKSGVGLRKPELWWVLEGTFLPVPLEVPEEEYAIGVKPPE